MKEKYNWATGGRALSLEERKIARRLEIAAPQAPKSASLGSHGGGVVSPMGEPLLPKSAGVTSAVAATSKSRSVWDWWSPTELQPNTDIG